VLDETPGSFIKPPAPLPDPNQAVEGINDFIDDVLPLIALERAKYRREAAQAERRVGGG
jgi:hypothetical protein